MKKWMACVAAVSLALVGCGGNACDDLADGFNAAAEKGNDCRNLFPGGGALLEELSDSDIDQCKDDLENCSDSDKDVVKDMGKCLEDVPRCTPSDLTPYGNALEACVSTALSKVTPACRATIEMKMPRDVASVVHSR